MREHLVVALAFLSISVTLCLADRSPIHPNTIAAESGFTLTLESVVNQKVDGPFVYRALVPYLEWTLLQTTSFPVLTIDFFLKALALTACQWVFWSYLMVWFSRTESLLGVFLLSVFIMAGLSIGAGPWPSETTDILNIFFFALSLHLLLAGRFSWLLLALAVGTLNRETTWLMLPLVAAETRSRSRSVLWFLGATAAVAVPYVLLRLTIESPNPVWWTTDSLAKNIPFLSAASTADAVISNLRMVLLLGPFLLVGAFRFRENPGFLKLTAWIIPPYIVVHYLFGRTTEIRLWVPLLLVLIPLALSGLRRIWDQKLTTDD